MWSLGGYQTLRPRRARACFCKLEARTCARAHAPRGQSVGRGEAVEHANVLGRQELHKLGVVEHFALAVQDGRRLFRDVNNLPRDEGDGDGEDILMAEINQM